MSLLLSSFGMVALTTSLIGLLPQSYKAYQTKSTHDLSYIMLINYLICSIAWIGYGAITKTNFVMLSNIVGLLSTILLMAQKYYYDQRGAPYAAK